MFSPEPWTGDLESHSPVRQPLFQQLDLQVHDLENVVLGQAAVVQDLKKNVENIGMSFLDLIQKNEHVRLPRMDRSA